MKIVCATAIGLACLLMSYCDEINTAIDASKEATQDALVQVEHANESPLDAVVYDAPPVFASYGSSNAYRITDRFSKSEWWLVKIGAEWVVLPITNTEVTNVG
jgi:hypothetical protein